jgi:hypothetical protein
MSPLTEPTRLTLKKESVAATDTNIREVSLLLHGDGANGSTTIVDSSLSPKTVTAFGNTQISTAQSKFGGASIAFDGNGDYLQSPTSSDFAFGTGDFTLETWLYPLGFSGDAPTFNNFGAVFDFRTAPSSQAQILWTFLGSSTLVLYVNGATRITGTAISTNQWTHVALSRSSGSTKMFVNSTQVGSTYADSNNYTSSAFKIASNVSTDAFYNGYIDDLRITKGVARYTSNFTPPTAPFPDF